MNNSAPPVSHFFFEFCLAFLPPPLLFYFDTQTPKKYQKSFLHANPEHIRGMPHTSTEQRARICALVECGQSARTVAREEGVSVATVYRIIKKHKDGLGYEYNEKSGRPRHFTERDERSMIRLLATGKCKNAEEIKAALKDYEGSTQTIRNALWRHGMRGRACRKKPLLSKKHRKRRLAFAKKYRSWGAEEWRRVIWSDESKFNVFGSDGRTWCWRKNGEAMKDLYVKPTVKHGGGNVMVWGCMTSHGVGYLCRIENGLDAELYQKILSEDYLGTLGWYGLEPKNVIFQHDNDPKHTAKSTKQWLSDHKVEVLDWPPQSPDLNPIEHLWSEVERRLKQLSELPSTPADLWDKMQDVWNEIDTEVCLNLIDTMPERIKDVIGAKGGYTRW